MDGLALLCNLHADGPLSLRRLRRSGVDTLDDLGRQSETWLAATLKASPSQVRRFRHEGRLLSRRLAELPLESEFHEDTPIPGDVRARLLKEIVRPPVAYDLSPPDLDEAEPYQHEPCQYEPGQPAEAAASGESEESGEVEAIEERGPTLFDDLPAEAPPRATVAPEAVPLKIGELPGLDSRTCQQLVAQGVRTYQALVDLASLNLARRTGIPFTRLLDLRHHARALLEARPASPAPEPRERQVELTPRPRPPLSTASDPFIGASEARAALLRRDPRKVASGPPAPEAPAHPAVPSRSPAQLQEGAPDEPGVSGPFV